MDYAFEGYNSYLEVLHKKRMGVNVLMNSIQILLETKLVSEIKGSFFIPSYQRGYRWGKDEVLRLLNDVYDNGKKNYCLQPIVVKRKEDSSLELIDGQQRLTTLYLIYRYMKDVNPFFSEPSFSLDYGTRESSKSFLQTIDVSRREENIDFWFISNAYETIKEWFEVDLQIRVLHVFEYFKENVKLIWYEVGEDEDPISLFTRLNIGKIPLTSSELVKAMFLSSKTGNELSYTEKQKEIALQWDNMEKELHDSSFWFFLTNNNSGHYQTRVDLILDLISEKTADNREKYYTFFRIDEMGRCESLDEVWQTIQQSYLILKDWYKNHELYHKIGYLIASETLSLLEIFKASEGKTKTEFRETIDSFIRKSIAIQGNYAELSYQKSSDYKKISKLLLLFNVESVRKSGNQTQWFPFNRYKTGQQGKVAWSLEHIHAQQSEGLRTQEMWKEWLNLHVPSVVAVDPDSPVIIEMKDAIAKQKLDGADFVDIQKKVIEILSAQGGAEYLHSISNLALLRSDNNAALNNSTFDVKRNKIIEMDKEGEFIPFCTKMVFFKYYTPSEFNQLHFWGQADRIAYLKAMNKVLNPYLSEPITIMEEMK